MKYSIFRSLDVDDKKAMKKLVEDALQGKTASIPIKGLEDNFLAGIKTFLMEREYQSGPKPVKVEFDRDYKGEINFETDSCGYINLKGNLYYAWGKGYLQETEDEILLILNVSWDETYAQ